MAHTCHAPLCQVIVAPEMLMCRLHWYRVPRKLRNRVWATYRVGQCDDWQITREYARAASAAVTYVGLMEGVPLAAIRNARRVYSVLAPR